jgi:hypothetical protein
MLRIGASLAIELKEKALAQTKPFEGFLKPIFPSRREPAHCSTNHRIVTEILRPVWRVEAGRSTCHAEFAMQPRNPRIFQTAGKSHGLCSTPKSVASFPGEYSETPTLFKGFPNTGNSYTLSQSKN